MAEQSQILRPTPRRTFDLTPVSTESSIPPSPSPERTNSDLLEAKIDSPSPPSKTRSILNLTSSTLLGIYSPTGYEASRDELLTPWGTGAQTPNHRRSVDDSRPSPSTADWNLSQGQTRANLKYRRTGFRGHYLRLFLRGLLLFAFGVAYGLIITHLHDNQNLAPVRVEGIKRHSWHYLYYWGISGVALGSLLPWVDVIWGVPSNQLPSEQRQARATRYSGSVRGRDGKERLISRFESGLGADWNPVVRSIGAFVGIAFAIVRIKRSTLRLKY